MNVDCLIALYQPTHPCNRDGQLYGNNSYRIFPKKEDKIIEIMLSTSRTLNKF
jgi:hypothetical protein